MAAATLIPPTRTQGARPPIVPPTRTTFDGTPGDHDESPEKLLSDSIYRLLRTIENTPSDRLHLLLGLLEHRKTWLEREVTMERVFDSPSLPPPAFNFLMLGEILEAENSRVKTYLRLIQALEDGIDRVRAKIRELNVPSFASELA